MRLLFLALLLVACTRDDANRGPPCLTVGARAIVLAEHDAENAPLPADDLRILAARAETLRARVVEACTRDRWSAAVRECLTAARDRAAFEACERGLTDEQRARIAATAAPSSW
ncbi:MAG TPA: hypothetical protein VGM88_08390 [Kofleriaceae bacterium]|jgi:hypothetical protein